MPKNVAILGFAHGHVMAFGEEWVKKPELGITVTAGWDHDAARLQASAKSFPDMKPCTSVDEALALADAVVISSETSLHAELIEKAAAAGKAIICYKPLALTMAEADRIVAAVEKYQVPFTMGYQSRVDAQNIRIREMIQNQEIGATYLYRRRHGLSTHLWNDFEHTWHNNPAYNRDIFADDSSHPIDMMNWIFGMPETVYAEISTMHNPAVPNDTAVLIFKYANGMIAEITCPFACTASEITTEVYGAKGSIIQSYGDAVSTGLPRPEGQPGLKYCFAGENTWIDSGIESPAVHRRRLVDQAAPFADFLYDRRDAICTVYEGRNDLRLVLACYVSAREGRRVSVQEADVYEI